MTSLSFASIAHPLLSRHSRHAADVVAPVLRLSLAQPSSCSRVYNISLPGILAFLLLAPHDKCGHASHSLKQACKSQNLSQLSSSGGSEFQSDTVGQIAPEIASYCTGMHYLHSAKPPIIHRDLKSMNLLVENDLTIKVGRFPTSFSHATQAGCRS